MDVLWVLLIFNCFLLSTGEEGGATANCTEPHEETAQELKLFPANPKYAGQTRTPRTLFKKLHSGAAFLTGLKLGAILSKKGFELGHGKIASTHSFQIFGKSVNSAMSLSYGDRASHLPLVDDDSKSTIKKKSGLNKEDQKVFHVTVIENLSNETEPPLANKGGEEQQNEVSADGNTGKGDLLVLYDSIGEEPEQESEVNFLEEHNNRVKEFNENAFSRQNSKF